MNPACSQRATDEHIALADTRPEVNGVCASPAGAVSGMTANRPTGSPGVEEMVEPAAGGGLIGATMAGSRQAVSTLLVTGLPLHIRMARMSRRP